MGCSRYGGRGRRRTHKWSYQRKNILAVKHNIIRKISTYNPHTAGDSYDADHGRAPFCALSRHIGLEEEVGHDEPHGEDQRADVKKKEM